MTINISLLSPYHSGSHKAWAEGYAAHSTHTIQLLTMQGRFWKWRMHGGAVTLARQFMALDQKPDLILTDGMLDLTTFIALTRQRTYDIPLVLYMHENQLTYPLPADPTTGAMRRNHNERDHHYVFINYSSLLVADQIIFNSHYHLESWFEAVPRYLRHYPDHREADNIAKTREKSIVLPVGIHAVNAPARQKNDLPPLILWNQRWEYDKNPEAFFQALYRLHERGIAFRLAVCGENFSRKPTIFEEAADKLKAQIVHFGYADRERYNQLLDSAEIVVSTALHEFFGISIIEAILHGAFPILPRRLSYPELIPATLHEHIFYENDTQLDEQLAFALTHPAQIRPLADQLTISAKKYTWPTIVPSYDTLMQRLTKRANSVNARSGSNFSV